ncbi:hypothetical protein BH23PLA1_BH23PLA1_27780 [soil metagenome]
MGDGARNALGGYLYQFLGAAGLTARAQVSAGASSADGMRLNSQVRQGIVIHEQDDMDVVVRLPGRMDAIGVQFKYSQETPPRPIERSELIEILDAFHRSTTGSRDYRFSEYVLVTNRSLAYSAQSLFETRSQDSPDPTLVPQTVKGKRTVKKAQRVLGHYGSPEQAAAERHAILAKLTTEPDVSQEAWIDQVRAFASRHGMFPFEFEAALDRLVGRILHCTIGRPLEITIESLNECLFGVPDARPLDLTREAGSAHTAARAALSTTAFTSLVEDKASLVPRRLIEEVEKQAALHTVVFLMGDGGSGKSVLATQFLQNEAHHRFVAFVAASGVEDNWLGRKLNSWRSPRFSHNLRIESIDDVIGRLRHANPRTPRPVLLLNLDGIDEVADDHRHSTRRLINHFWEMRRSGTSEAVLLVTCRTPPGDAERAVQRVLGRWFVSDVPRQLVDTIGTVFVGDFDAAELGEAARALGSDYWRRLSQDPSRVDDADIGSAVLGGETVTRGSDRPVHPAMAESLRHPAMWGALVGLPPERRHHALDGEPSARSDLAMRFLERFCSKATRRRPSLTDDRLLKALRAICTSAAGDLSGLTRQEHWIEPARGPMMDEEAAYLFDEAISYGLIAEDARGQWMWRHGFVRDHLRGH